MLQYTILNQWPKSEGTGEGAVTIWVVGGLFTGARFQKHRRNRPDFNTGRAPNFFNPTPGSQIINAHHDRSQSEPTKWYNTERGMEIPHNRNKANVLSLYIQNLVSLLKSRIPKGDDIEC
eukprot:sb/3476183/